MKQPLKYRSFVLISSASTITYDGSLTHNLHKGKCVILPKYIILFNLKLSINLKLTKPLSLRRNREKMFLMTGDSFQHIYKAYNMQYIYIVDNLAPSYRDVFSNFQMGPPCPFLCLTLS